MSDQVQAQLANAEAERTAAVLRAESAEERADGMLLELQRARADAEALRKEAEGLRRERDQAIEHDTAISRLLGRAQKVLDDAGIEKEHVRVVGAPGTSILAQLHDRIVLVLKRLRDTEGALDHVEEERSEAVLRAMTAEDRGQQLHDRCLRLELYAMRLVDRVTPWRERS